MKSLLMGVVKEVNPLSWPLLILSSFCSLLATVFGGWDIKLTGLVLLMIVDYGMGLLVAGVFHKSPKSRDGGLESRAGLKGLLRKGAMLAVILVAAVLDIMMESTIVKDGVVLAFSANEVLSIVENVGLMGVPMPEVITKAVDMLHRSRTENAVKASPDAPEGGGTPA